MSPEVNSTTSPLVLVIEDDEGMRLIIRTVLQREGYRLEESEDGVQGLSRFEQLQPDIVLLDVMMPLMDGFETCSRLRRLPQGDRVPVIMVTALEDNAAIKRAFEAGATDYITKPIRAPVLVQRIGAVLRAKQAEDAWREEANRYRVTVASIVQELDTPLQLLADMSQGLLTRIGRGNIEPDYLSYQLELINCNGQRCARLAQAFNHYHTLTHGSTVPDLNTLVGDILLLVRPQIRQYPNITISTQLASYVPALAAGQDHLMPECINRVLDTCQKLANGGEIIIGTAYEAPSEQASLFINYTGANQPDYIWANIDRSFCANEAVTPVTPPLSIDRSSRKNI